MRIIPAATAVAAAMSLDPRAGQEALVRTDGHRRRGHARELHHPDLRLCVQEVIAGNRGFCIPNPRWQDPRPGARQTRARRKRVDY